MLQVTEDGWDEVAPQCRGCAEALPADPHSPQTEPQLPHGGGTSSQPPKFALSCTKAVWSLPPTCLRG